MRTSDNIDKIIPALAKAHNDMPKIGKSGENKFHKYKYATLESFLSDEVRAVLAEEDLCIVGSNSEAEIYDGDARYAHIKLTLRIFHISGQWVEIDVHGEGGDKGDKGVYKALTGARKYGIALLLNLVTTDDPEKDEPARKQTTTSDNVEELI